MNLCSNLQKPSRPSKISGYAPVELLNESPFSENRLGTKFEVKVDQF